MTNNKRKKKRLAESNGLHHVLFAVSRVSTHTCRCLLPCSTPMLCWLGPTHTCQMLTCLFDSNAVLAWTHAYVPMFAVFAHAMVYTNRLPPTPALECWVSQPLDSFSVPSSPAHLQQQGWVQVCIAFETSPHGSKPPSQWRAWEDRRTAVPTTRMTPSLEVVTQGGSAEAPTPTPEGMATGTPPYRLIA